MPDKKSVALFNGWTQFFIQLFFLVFAAGALWSKVTAIEKSVNHLTDRVGKIESVLMKGP